MSNLISRLICFGISCIASLGAYKIITRLFFETDDIFSGGDPFVIVLLPFFLVFFLFVLAALAVLVVVAAISGIYAIHPPLAIWISNNMNEPPKSESEPKKIENEQETDS